jgi:uncharacterized membrane protein YqiK
VHQARIQAEAAAKERVAGAEAAAGQRLAAALAHERANLSKELGKQARSYPTLLLPNPMHCTSLPPQVISPVTDRQQD